MREDLICKRDEHAEGITEVEELYLQEVSYAINTINERNIFSVSQDNVMAVVQVAHDDGADKSDL